MASILFAGVTEAFLESKIISPSRTPFLIHNNENSLTSSFSSRVLFLSCSRSHTMANSWHRKQSWENQYLREFWPSCIKSHLILNNIKLPCYSRIRLFPSDDDTHYSHHTSISHRLTEETSSSYSTYTGPLFQRDYSEFEGGIALMEHSLQLLVGPSEVALGQSGLYISLLDTHNEEEHHDEYPDTSKPTETRITAGTPICGYSRGYFTDEYQGDKSVAFLFHGYAHAFGVFYDKRLVSLEYAIQSFLSKHRNNDDNTNTTVCSSTDDEAWDSLSSPRNDILYGHILTRVLPTNDKNNTTTWSSIYVQPDPSFHSRIFIPETFTDEHQHMKYTAPYLGMYANDFAYDPEYHNTADYHTRSEQNNILDLAWRLTEGTITTIAGDLQPIQQQEKNHGLSKLLLIPTWPVVKVRSDIRIVNEIPMELGLQYGFTYWDAYHNKEN